MKIDITPKEARLLREAVRTWRDTVFSPAGCSNCRDTLGRSRHPGCETHRPELLAASRLLHAVDEVRPTA